MGDAVLEEIRAFFSLAVYFAEHTSVRDVNAVRTMAVCPFHADRRPSLSIDNDQGLYYCFGCHAGGDIFTAVQHLESVSFPEAVRLLASRAGIELPETFGRSLRPLKEGLATIVQAARAAFRTQELPGARQAQEWLAARGIGAEAAERFQAGWLPPFGTWVRTMPRVAKAARELSLRPAFGHLVFPILSARGEPLALAVRGYPERGEPKYFNTATSPLYDKSRCAFGTAQALEAVRARGAVILVEGTIDVLSMHQAGFTNTISLLGTRAQPAQLYPFRFAERCVALFDGDAAGRQAAWSLGRLCRLDLPSVWVATLDSGDPDDWCRQDVQHIQKALDRALPWDQWLVREATHDLTDSQGRVVAPAAQVSAMHARVQRALQVIPDRVYAARVAQEWSQAIGVDISLMPVSAAPVPSNPANSTITPAELEGLRAVAHHVNGWPVPVTPRWFRSTAAQTISAMLQEGRDAAAIRAQVGDDPETLRILAQATYTPPQADPAPIPWWYRVMATEAINSSRISQLERAQLITCLANWGRPAG